MKVIVIGAGYAGTIAANRLARRAPAVEVTVVNPLPDFVDRIRLHQQITGTGSALRPLAEMLRPQVARRQGSVDKIGDGQVLLEDGESLSFDHAVLAVGSTAAPLPGTLAIGTWEGAHEAQTRLAELAPGASVTVIGGGLTGIETASEVAEARSDLQVTIVAPTLGDSLHPAAVGRVRRRLARLGVTICEDIVLAAASDHLSLSSGEKLESDLGLWAVIGTVPDLARRSGLDVDEHGRALVDPYLRSVTDPRVFVVGDCARVPGARAACATALPQGAHAADTLARLDRGRQPKPYSMGYAGQGLSLGRNDGLQQSTRRDDTPRRLHVGGPIAALIKEGVTRYATYGARTGNFEWLRGPR